jgi:hypothetical protein
MAKHKRRKPYVAGKKGIHTNEPAQPARQKERSAVAGKAKTAITKKIVIGKIVVTGTAIAVALSLILNLFGLIPLWDNLTLSDYEKFKRGNTIQGLLIPENIRKDTSHLIFVKGNHYMFMRYDSIPREREFGFKSLFADRYLNPLDVQYYFENNRLFVRYDLYDINAESVGSINRNKWELEKSMITDYYDDDSTLEVLDKSRNVVFSIAFRSPNKIIIQGYSTHPYTCAVIDTSRSIYAMNEPDCKNFILQNARKIQSYTMPKRKNSARIYLVTFGLIAFILLSAWLYRKYW